MQRSLKRTTGLTNRLIAGSSSRLSATFSLLVLAGLYLGGCSGQSQDPAAQAASNPGSPAAVADAAPGDTNAMEKGMYFKPETNEFALHNEYDDDGDGDGINETSIRHYINRQGDTLFSMTTNGTLWAWSLDTKGSDDSATRENYVIRDSNCDGVFDERYRLDAEFHVPACLIGEANADPH